MLHLEVQIGSSQKESAEMYSKKRSGMSKGGEIDLRGWEDSGVSRGGVSEKVCKDLQEAPWTHPLVDKSYHGILSPETKGRKQCQRKDRGCCLLSSLEWTFSNTKDHPWSTRTSTGPRFTWAKRRLTPRSHSSGSTVKFCEYEVNMCACVCV